MRISLRPSDSGFHTHRVMRANGKKAHIKLNGEAQYGCITADDEVGMIVRLKTPMTFDADRQCMVDEVLHGKVEIDIQDEMVL